MKEEMLDARLCNWLMENADVPIRYRIAREILKDEAMEKELRKELLAHPAVIAALRNLDPEMSQNRMMQEHGALDYFFENAILMSANVGLHGDIPELKKAVSYYAQKMETIDAFDGYFGRSGSEKVYYRRGQLFPAILIANFLEYTDTSSEASTNFLLGSLDELYKFACMGNYDFYLSEEERKKLKGVPAVWRNNQYFLRKELVWEYGFSYPLIYDLFGLGSLYKKNDAEINNKIDRITDYITNDTFHEKICDGYGTLVEKDGKYHGMGWDPKYPGWFDAVDYLENNEASRLLCYALIISVFPSARKTEWFGKLLEHLQSFRTERGTYIFKKEWLQEVHRNAVLGYHMSCGENRRKKGWTEVESTFYMLRLLRNIQGL